ncbi:MAG: phosphatase PAP2 family protein [Actinomycetota bacterium]
MTSRRHSADPRPIRALLLAGASVAVGIASHRGAGSELDAKAFHALNGAHSSARDRLFAGVTELGSIYASVAAAVAIAATGRSRPAARALAAASATWFLGQALKKGFGRPRPFHAHPETARRLIDPPSGTSWPSSHPAVLLAFLTVAARELDLPAPVRAALLGLAGAVGVSRVYLGVHFPSDVVGGLLMGRAVGLVWPRVP